MPASVISWTENETLANRDIKSFQDILKAWGPRRRGSLSIVRSNGWFTATQKVLSISSGLAYCRPYTAGNSLRRTWMG